MNRTTATQPPRLSKQPSTLFHSCVRFVAKNLGRYRDIEYLELLPPLIKNAIILNVTRAQKGFHDDELPALLLNHTLTRINLSTSTITDGMLFLLAEKCPHLRSLTLSLGTYRFSRAGLEALIRRVTKLQQLFLKNCPFVDDRMIELLAANCPQLDLVDFESCAGITDESAQHIKGMRLTKLNLSRTNITDEFLKQIAVESCGKCLEDLNIGHCRITAAGLVKLPWDTISYIGFEGCDIEDLEFIGVNKNLKYIQWTISN